LTSRAIRVTRKIVIDLAGKESKKHETKYHTES
jgi:hypothetical protein